VVNGPEPIKDLTTGVFLEGHATPPSFPAEAGNIPPNTKLRYAIVNYDTVKGFSKPTEIEHTTDSAAGKRTVIIWVIDPNEVANSVYIYRMYQGVWHYVGMINEPAYDARHAFFDEYYELTDGGDPGDTTDFSPENLDGVY